MKRAFSILALAGALLLGLVPPAIPQGTIAIQGATSGTHLRLSVDGSTLLVTGPMAAVSGGCRFNLGRGGVACGLTDVGSIEVDTGPANDKVEVLDPLPAPLTAHLGEGSDKLIGNRESDICYPEGTPRNRCIGGGGDDVCIAGPVNTDCVGGFGDDFCQMSSGSDGCWGGPGDDVCRMGRGDDGCHGEGGDDKLYGGPGSDQLYGGPGYDYCEGLPGLGHSHECESGPRH